jgi:hypothetical protein
MKTIIAALALILLAAGPTFAARAYVPQSGYVPQGGFDGGANYSSTSREGLIHAN